MSCVAVVVMLVAVAVVCASKPPEDVNEESEEDEIEEHFVHVLCEVAPAAVEYVPISQSVQVPAPGSTLYLPAGHWPSSNSGFPVSASNTISPSKSFFGFRYCC